MAEEYDNLGNVTPVNGNPTYLDIQKEGEKHEHNSGSKTTVKDYGQFIDPDTKLPITYQQYQEKFGVGEREVKTPQQIEQSIQDYINFYKKNTTQPEKPEEELARLAREKKWNILGEILGKTVGLVSDVSSAAQGGIVPRRETKIDTTKFDARKKAIDDDYKNRLALYNKDMLDRSEKIRAQILGENKDALDFNKQLRQSYYDAMGRVRTETTTDNTRKDTTSKTNDVKIAAGGTGAGGASGGTRWHGIIVTPKKDGGGGFTFEYDAKNNNVVSSVINTITDIAMRNGFDKSNPTEWGKIQNLVAQANIALREGNTELFEKICSSIVNNDALYPYAKQAMDDMVKSSPYVRYTTTGQPVEQKNDEPLTAEKVGLEPPVWQGGEQKDTGYQAAVSMFN